MKRIDNGSPQPWGMSIPINGPVVALITLLIFPVFIRAQTNPLSSTYIPAIDTNAADYPSNIWITNTMQKVRQDSGSPGTQHWGTFYGTQNEFVDFQVHFHDTGSGTSNLSVTASNFVQSSPASYTIGTSANDIIVYRDAYMHVQTQVTSTASTYYNSLGYYPDILIPPTDPYHHQTTNAWPVTVGAGNNQSAWVDVHIPTGALAGYYLGSITVKSGSTTLATMPVIIGVWQWPSGGYMPSSATVHVAAGINGADMCYQTYGGSIYDDCGSWPGASTGDQGLTLAAVDGCLMALDHRYGGCWIYPPYPSPPTQTGELSFRTAYGPLYSGTAPTILPGAKAWGVDYPISGTASLQNWATWWQGAGYSGPMLTYPCDEPPNGCSWAQVVTNGTTAHAIKPPVPVLLTAGLANVTANNALNSVDIMTVLIDQMEPIGGPNNRSTYNTWLAGNCCGAGSPTRQLWHYNDCVGTGTCGNGTVGRGVTYANVDVDGSPAANREFQWTTFAQSESGELYYTMTGAWEANGGGCCTVSNPNPWNTVYYFGGWGEGTLVYPSTSQGTNYVTASGGGALTYPIYLPSIRLKHIRDGMQDYEYLNVLTSNGQGSFATNEVNSWITNSYTFETTGAGLQAARLALGNQMHGLTYSSSAPAVPTGLSIKVQ